MNTLKEIVELAGLTGPNKFTPLLGNSGFTEPTMATVGLQVPVLTSEQKTSMQAMIIALQNLPRISLDAEAVALAGEVPFFPKIHVHATAGIVLETIGNIFKNGNLVFASSSNFGALDAIMGIAVINEPGSYQFEVTRIGIQNTGITVLKKSFNLTANAKPVPPDHQTPIPSNPPVVTCGVEMDLDNPGFGGVTNFRIFGGGFVPEEKVEIIEGVNLFATTKADTFNGSYNVTVGVPNSQFRSVMHTIFAKGKSSGRASNTVGFTN